MLKIGAHLGLTFELFVALKKKRTNYLIRLQVIKIIMMNLRGDVIQETTPSFLHSLPNKGNTKQKL